MRPLAHTLIIAEAGVNHDGSLDRALALVDAAAAAGADVVKFQTFRADALVTAAAPRAAYQDRNTGDADSQRAMLAKLELDLDAHRTLIDRCRTRGITFLSSPFDLASADLLCDTLALPLLKLGSGEITNAPLLLRLAQHDAPLILSTGMSTLDDVDAALGVLAFGYARSGAAPSLAAFLAADRAILQGRVTLLHCTTEYPAPLDDVNLRAMDALRQTFGLPVGYSDHTAGIAIPLAAVARGACVIEKHLTLDRTAPGPDHAASIEPDTFAQMVAGIRAIERALGDGEKRPMPSEVANMAVARKSLVALGAIRAGEAFTGDNLGVKRPGTGVSPMGYWEVLGTLAHRDYAPDALIVP